MGMYFNPKNQTPQEWLDTHAERLIYNACVYDFPQWGQQSNGCMLVVLIKGHRSCIGIGYNEKEYNILIEPDDRLKIVYQVTIDDLIENKKLERYLKYQCP